jgi:alpha-methylacyl-CoA racemase
VAAIGPVPLAGMLLSDLGATITRVDRPARARVSRMVDPTRDFVSRGRRSVVVDLQTEAGTTRFMSLVAGADVLLEGHRPGVMERLGIGPDVVLEANPRLVYGRMTGWGQSGP